jgi:hypothetical protein
MKKLLKNKDLADAIQSALKLTKTTMTHSASSQLDMFKSGQALTQLSGKGKGKGKNRTQPSEIPPSRASSTLTQEKKPAKKSQEESADVDEEPADVDTEPAEIVDLSDLAGNDMVEVEPSEDEDEPQQGTTQDEDNWDEINPFEVIDLLFYDCP